MKKTAIVTDSTAYITKEHVNEYDIHIIPLNVVIGNPLCNRIISYFCNICCLIDWNMNKNSRTHL